jgi:3-methyladenine DNA glycosylase AlkD
MNPDRLVARLRAMGTERDRAGMARYGINVANAAGVGVTTLRTMARELPRDHELALGLWATGLHEARILASMVDEPDLDLCDQCCANLFWRTLHADGRTLVWSGRRAEFVKRGGFALMASAAVKDRDAPDDRFVTYLQVIERQATDPRNFVRKAVNWALRQIGKRNAALHRRAVAAARRIARIDDRTARWIAGDALRELTDPRTIRRLR